MSAALLVAGIAAAVGLLVFVGYKFGERANALVVKYEQEARQAYADAHNEVSAKLASVKAEVAKIEAEGKAEEKSVVARLKALL